MPTRLRNFVDREWAKVDWCGYQTLNHRLVAATPCFFSGVAFWLLSMPYWVGIACAILVVSFSGLLTLWIEGRRLVGTGAFSTKRSENFIRRMNAKRQKHMDQRCDHEDN